MEDHGMGMKIRDDLSFLENQLDQAESLCQKLRGQVKEKRREYYTSNDRGNPLPLGFGIDIQQLANLGTNVSFIVGRIQGRYQMFKELELVLSWGEEAREKAGN